MRGCSRKYTGMTWACEAALSSHLLPPAPSHHHLQSNAVATSQMSAWRCFHYLKCLPTRPSHCLPSLDDLESETWKVMFYHEKKSKLPHSRNMSLLSFRSNSVGICKWLRFHCHCQHNIEENKKGLIWLIISGRLAPTDVHVASPQRRVPPER